MYLLLISDTHLPKRAKALPSQVWDEVSRADVVIHAGDWVDIATLDALEARSRRLIGVFGNNDGPPLRHRLPQVAFADLAGVRFAVIHETGPAQGRESRMAAAFPDVDVLVFGHSHIPWDTTTASGLRLLNPGSPTDRRRQPACTYLTAEVSSGELTNVVLHELPSRTALKVSRPATSPARHAIAPHEHPRGRPLRARIGDRRLERALPRMRP